MPKFNLGRIVATPSTLAVVSNPEILVSLALHHAGEWGELDPEDHAANESALEHGGRLFSAYRTAAGVKFWIITECDRSATTILLPSDY